MPKKDEIKLIETRRTLENIRSYLSFIAKQSESGVISPGSSWQEQLKDVASIVEEWAEGALERSGGPLKEEEEDKGYHVPKKEDLKDIQNG